jgi:cytochrome c oxidase assembly protein subunit 15
VVTAASTLGLIGIGGMVTSHEAGMAVPDWPTSYGYNPFLFPLDKWWHSGNIFYEHSHRLFASGVGLLTIFLAVGIWLADLRWWLRWLGIGAVIAVVLQGVLGGLRVILFKDEIGIFHATLAQLFFTLTCAIALFTSKRWLEWRLPEPPDAAGASPSAVSTSTPKLRRLFLAATGLILFQLILGATMRHEHAGLSISDFPLAHGKLWPAMDPASIARYNAERSDLNSLAPITAFQVGLQMTHRIVALLILAAVSGCAWMAVRCFTVRNGTSKAALFWVGLIVVQAGLGATTVLSHKAADVATAHVLVGALSLATGVLLCIVSLCNPDSVHRASALSRAGTRTRDESTFAASSAAVQ